MGTQVGLSSSRGAMSADETKCGRRPVRTPPTPENCCETNSNGDKGSGGGVVFHRAREWPMPDPNDPPIKKIQFLLDRYRIKEALHVFFCDTTIRLLSEEPDFMWDVIPLICRRLRGLCQYRFRVFEGCERMLCRIAVEESCNPKEVLISLLSEISHSDNLGDDNVFRAMIRPLEGTLLRMSLPSPREKSFRWTLTVLMRHIYDIELPQEYNIEGKKRLSLPNDSSVRRYIEVLPLMFNFIDEFNDKPLTFDRSPMPILTESQIDEVLNGELVDDDDFMSSHTSLRCDITDASLTSLMHLVSRPLTYLDLTVDCKPLKSTSVRCLNIILKLMPNLFVPIYKRSLVCPRSPANPSQEVTTISESISASVTSLASNHFDGNESEAILTLAICAYIFRCCANYVNPTSATLEMVPSFPQVLSQETLLYCHTPYVVVLLRRSEILAHEKGLILLENLLIAIDSDTLDQKYLDLFRTSNLMQQLFHIMVFSPYCKNRRRAYDLFTRICDLLTHDCKLQMFKWVLGKTDLRPCIRAACIDQYRRHLAIIQKNLLKYHQQLSLITALSAAPKGGSKSTSRSSSENGLSNASNASNNILKQLISGQEAFTPDLESKIKIKSTDEIWTMSNNIMDQINLWQARYKVIGGQELVNFLNLCVEACLPETQHTDIIENYELLLATLTMFRYLRLRKTLVKDDIEDQYLCAKKLKKLLFDPVRSAIAMLTAELKSHHKEIAKGEGSGNAAQMKQVQVINDVGEGPPTSSKQIKNGSDVVSALMNSKLANLPIVCDSQPDLELKETNNLIPSAGCNKDNSNLEEPDEIECLNWVLCRLDLVDSVLVRTCDLYDC